MSLRTITPCRPLQVLNLSDEASPPQVYENLFELMAAISASEGRALLAVSVPGEDIAPARPDPGWVHLDYALWVRYGDIWGYKMAGATSLAEIAPEFLELVLAGEMDEIRICPPRTPRPRVMAPSA